MRLVGLIAGLFLVVGTWYIMSAASLGLPPSRRLEVVLPVIAVAVVMGLIYAAAVGRRGRGRRSHAALFAGMSLVVTAGVLGGAMALALTASYIATFAGWPTDLFDQVLLVAAFPVFTLLGVCVGCLVGLVMGVVVGGFLRVTIARG